MIEILMAAMAEPERVAPVADPALSEDLGILLLEDSPLPTIMDWLLRFVVICGGGGFLPC